MLAKGHILIRIQEEKTAAKADGQEKRQSWEDAKNPSGVKLDETEIFCAQAGNDYAADQIAGNDEKYVHANKAAGHDIGKGVENYHQDDGHGPEAVYVGAVFHYFIADFCLKMLRLPLLEKL